MDNGRPDYTGQDNFSSLVDFQKMMFIYNAVTDGWSVRQLDDGRFEFQKDRQKVTSDIWMDEYLRNFVTGYLLPRSAEK